MSYFWTTKEVAKLRLLYGTLTRQQLAPLFGRSAAAVGLQARKLGLRRNRRADTGAALEDYLRLRNAQGWPDSQVARAWGCNIKTVTRRRKALGLPEQKTSEWTRNKAREHCRAVCREHGVKTLRDVWRIAQSVKAARTGWPADLLPLETRVLDGLEAGKKTTTELAAFCGRARLSSHRPGGTALAYLVRRGLIVNLGRKHTRGGEATWALAPGVRRRQIGNPHQLIRYAPHQDESAA